MSENSEKDIIFPKVFQGDILKCLFCLFVLTGSNLLTLLYMTKKSKAKQILTAESREFLAFLNN